MKNLALLIFIFSLTATSFAQVSNSDVAKKTSNNLVKKETVLDEKEEFESAVGQSLASVRIAALQKFLKDFPESEMHTRAREVIVSSRAELADEKLRLSEIEEGIKLFKLAVEEAPTTISDRFFSGLLVKFPANLFFRGQRKAANEVAKMIEEKVADNPKRLLGLATFYLSTENASEAKRLAEKSIELDPNSSAAHHTVGFAHRLNFDLEKAAGSFQKALEVDSESVVSKISLAEMKRALGNANEAVTLYREILVSDPTNSNAQTGLALSLFDSGNKDEAEAEMSKSLAQNPKNLVLLVGAAYWYAANENGAKAVELSEQVLAFEQRYTWTYIAMARGFMQQNDPLSAERTLLAARQYGNFPTLEYELASTRLAAGFYKEAAEGLRNSFTVEDGVLKTKLGGRVEREADNFIDLLSLERRASIFQSKPADTEENSRLLKNLLQFSEGLESDVGGDDTLRVSADKFISGEDRSKFHRQIYVANRLLEKKKALPKVLEITKEAVAGVDDALDVPSASAAVLAEELYESRKLAVAQGRTIIVPQISRPTLSKIMRGRIEEISGWALYQQEKPEEAKSRLRLASSVLPSDSAWSRSTMWKIGTILEGEGKSEEALDAYIKGYFAEEQSTAKKFVIENLYSNIHGNLDGLAERLEKKESANGSVSIFTGKSKNKKPEKEPEKKEDTAKDQETQNDDAVNTLDGKRVPKSVPIAKSTPIVTPTLVTDSHLIKIETEKPTETIDFANSETKPANDAGTLEDKTKVETSVAVSKPKVGEKIESDEDILKADTNITKLPKLPIETPEVNKPIQKKVDPEKKGLTIFEPIIIKVPEVSKTKIEDTVKKATDDKNSIDQDSKKESTDTVTKPIDDKPLVIDTTKTDDKAAGTEKKSDDTEADAKVDTGLERPRVVTEKPKDNDEVKTEETESDIKPCKILVSQNVVTIINGGGSLGVLVGLEEGKGDVKKIKAISSSPEDIEIVLEPEIGALSGRAFFIVKSISSVQGLFSVTFDTPCGEKEIPVKVR